MAIATTMVLTAANIATKDIKNTAKYKSTMVTMKNTTEDKYIILYTPFPPATCKSGVPKLDHYQILSADHFLFNLKIDKF